MATRYQLKQTGNIQLPTLIRCSHCNIKKPQTQYSATRLEDLRQYIIQAGVKKRDFQPGDTGFIRCTQCVGGPAVEHECYHCNITFPRNVLYFSKNMLKNRKDEALCWSCSEREQNDTLSSDESEGSGGGGSGYDSDDTNPFRGTDVGNLLSIGNERSSGGMPVNSSGGTIFGGGSSVASRSITTSSVSDFSDAPRITGDDASSISSFNTPGKKGFNPMNYGDPGLRQTSSVASRDSPKSKAWASVRPPASKVHSHAARQVQKEVKKRQPKANTNPYLLQDQASNKSLAIKGFGDEEEIPSDESDGEEPAPKPSAPPARGTQVNGTFSKSYIPAATADKDKDEDDLGKKLAPKEPKRQTTTDISRAVYSQEEAYHEIATFSDGSLSDDSDDYYGVEVDEGFHG